MAAFILAHERAPEFTFVGAWSKMGLAMAAQYGFSRDDLERTFLVIVAERAYSHSSAAIEVLERMRPPLRWLAAIRYAPRWMRDPGYSEIAKRRYLWFGQRHDCIVAPPEQRDRFPN